MDHKWGREVSDLGLAGGKATLAARYLAPFGDVVITNELDDSGLFKRWILPADPLVNNYAFDWHAPYLAAHFPYGQVVEPDEPR